MSAENWIEKLDLSPHPEGGFYKETYRSSTECAGRSASTAIYFLLRAQDVSHFHRIDADEMWHFYEGEPLTVNMLFPDGSSGHFTLGRNIDAGEVFQKYVPKGVWFGAQVQTEGRYSLVGCTVAPAFEFSGFEMATREALLKDYPDHEDLIKQLTPTPKD